MMELNIITKKLLIYLKSMCRHSIEAEAPLTLLCPVQVRSCVVHDVLHTQVNDTLNSHLKLLRSWRSYLCSKFLNFSYSFGTGIVRNYESLDSLLHKSV